jgi:hypothetical protein
MGAGMNDTDVRSIIEETLKSGNKQIPGLFDLPKIMSVKTQLESCLSVNDVIGVLEDNRKLLTKAFELSDPLFEQGLDKLKALA